MWIPAILLMLIIGAIASGFGEDEDERPPSGDSEDDAEPPYYADEDPDD